MTDASMEPIGPDDDPGWSFSPRMLLWLVPGYLQLALRSNGGKVSDGLEATRQVWVTFVGALFLFGVVIRMTVAGPASGSVVPWIAGLAVVAVANLVAAEVFGRRPLDCTDQARLAGSYRTRFFLRTAFSESVALFAFTASFIVERWWIYWMFLPFALFGFWRNAPTRVHLEADQQRLRLNGCPHSLVRALRSPPPR
jgi:F0F1-type ATP synthase membrane subunit c/vacuolar-type H+-ATPase subunit K